MGPFYGLLVRGRKMTNIFPFPARNTDPPTSWKAARINQRYRNGLRFRMLEFHGTQWARQGQFYLCRGLTDQEIVEGMNLPRLSAQGKPLCNWKRHGESYTDFGYLGVILVAGQPLERDGQRALVLTERGLEHLDDVLTQFP